MGFFEKLKAGLKKTKDSVFKQVNDIFKNFVSVDEDMLEELEEALISADVGVDASEEIIEKLRRVGADIEAVDIREPDDEKDIERIG